MEKILRFFCLLFLAACFSEVFVFAQKTQKHLDKIKNIEEQIDARNKELEKYSNKIENLKGQINNIKKDTEKENEKRRELEQNIEKTQSDITLMKSRYDILKDAYLKTVNEMIGDSSLLYLSKLSSSEYYQKNTIIRDITLRNIVVEKYAIAQSVDKKTISADKEVKSLLSKKNRVAVEKKAVLARLEKNKKSIGKTQKEIDLNKRILKELEQDIVRLKSSASELNALVKKLEKSAPYKKEGTDYLPIEENSLPWPVEGKVISRFGREYVAQLKTWIVRDGIRIKAFGNLNVSPVMSGKVIYAGAFRNYGNIVIIGHENNVFSTYGLLSAISVKNGDQVYPESQIGIVGEDLQALGGDKESNVLYFEIRKGSDAVNPAKFLK